MKIGIQSVLSKDMVPPLRQAVAIAARGFDSFHAGEHHHLPAATPVPEFYKETGVPDFYKFTPDPLIALAGVVVAAPRLAVGTSVLVTPIHDTLMLANRIATLDNLANGKLEIGLGVGWNAPELRHHGVDFDTRVEKTYEIIAAMKALWASDTASFDGEFVKFDESWQGPKPISQPHPPLLMGGRLLRKNLRIIVDLADGWFPTDTYEKTFGGALDADLAKLRAAMEQKGRDPASLKNSFLFAETFLYDRNPEDFAKAAPDRADLERYETLGFHRVIIGVPSFSEAHFESALDHVAKVAAPWLTTA